MQGMRGLEGGLTSEVLSSMLISLGGGKAGGMNAGGGVVPFPPMGISGGGGGGGLSGLVSLLSSLGVPPPEGQNLNHMPLPLPGVSGGVPPGSSQPVGALGSPPPPGGGSSGGSIVSSSGNSTQLLQALQQQHPGLMQQVRGVRVCIVCVCACACVCSRFSAAAAGVAAATPGALAAGEGCAPL